jgi:tetratricopeptide (TPR) repeat protein
MKYAAFISYSESDLREARALRSALKRYRIPKGLSRGKSTAPAIPSRLDVFLPDPTGTAPSEISLQALRESAFLVVLCSRSGARDPRVDREVRAFKRLGHPHNILTLILDGEPNAADGRKGFTAADECFPDALKYHVGADGELDRDRRFEPIAADARPHKDGRRAALLKIVAGLLGVGFDDLYHREQRRQQRRLLVAATASLVLAAVLAVGAFFSYQESRRQLAITREVTDYIQSIFSNADRAALQKMDPKLMSLILDNSAHELDQAKSRPDADVEAQMRQTLGQAYLACGLWEKAIANLRRSLALWEPIIGAGDPSALVSRRDLGEALIDAGQAAEAKDLLSHAPSSGAAIVRYELARALALTGDADDAKKLLDQEIATRPRALNQALQDPAFASIRSQLPAPH